MRGFFINTVLLACVQPLIGGINRRGEWDCAKRENFSEGNSHFEPCDLDGSGLRARGGLRA